MAAFGWRPSRRDVLKTAAAGAALSAATIAAADERPAGAIDAHVHVWTPPTDAYPLAEPWTKADMKPASFTPEQLFAHCRPEGVERVVLIQMSYYGFDNRYMLDTIARHPGKFVGVAVIDERDQPESTMRKLAQRGVRGFRIRPGKEQQPEAWLATPGMTTMWQVGAKERLAMCLLIDPAALPAVDAMCAKNPETPVVIDHFARIGADGEIRDADVASLCHLARHKHTSVKVSAFYALGKKAPPYLDLAPMIRRLLEAFGRDRLMWASDCPFQVDPGHNYRDSIELIRSRLDFLTAADRAALLGKTAERVYFG